jgi:translocation and assembly module TamB
VLERSGQLELRDGVFRFGSELPTASLVDADVELRGSALRIARGTGELGGAPFEFGGRVDLGAEPVFLDVTLSGEDLLLYRTRGIKVRADADLEVGGPLDRLLVSGKVALADSRYARNFEVDLTRRSGPSSGARGLTFFRLTEPPLSTMRFDVDIDTREAFQIGTTTVSGKVRPDLRLIGTGEVPVVTGAIYVDPTTISLPGSTLKIESGTIQFREEDPFMPRLALNGGTRLRGYDITVVVTGTLAEPEIILSSNPPLPDDELLLLVTTGQVPTEGEAASASDTARILAIYLAKDFLARWLSTESTESEESLLSRFDVVAGEDVSRSGSETIWVSFRVADDVVSTRDRLYLTAERDVFDKFNYGVRFVFRFR